MEKYDVSYYNELISKTWKLIDDDPLLWATWEIEAIKENFEAIQNAINNKAMDDDEKKWLFARIINSMVGWDKEFQYKSFEWKINAIFRQYDLTFDSIKNSIEMYEQYAEWLESENSNLEEFINWIDEEELSSPDKGQLNNYKVMLATLQTSLWRINMSKSSALELSKTMEITRPIFQATLSSCLIEVAGQKTIDASMQMLSTLSGTVENLSNKLTEATVKTSQMALEVWSKPVLNAWKIQQNMLLLQNTFDELEERRNQLLLTN